MHTMGWPLGKNAGGGSFIYHLDNNQVYVGFVVHLNYENPYLYPYMEFQRFKHHPMVAELLKGGKRIAYGARAISEGGWQSMPKAVAPGVAILGCGVGLVNVPRIKGNHNAMLSGIEAAEAAAAALAEGRSSDELTAYDDVHPQGRADREGPQAGAQRQAALVEIRASGRCRPGWRRHVDGQPHRLEPVRHDAPRQIGCRRHGQGANFKPIDYPRPDGVLSFDRLTNVSFSMTNHEESQPAHLTLKDAASRSRSTCPNMPSRRSGIARPESTRWSRRRARTRASSSTSRTASTARPAISRILRRTSTGPCRRAATGRIIPTCDADSRGAAGIPARIRVAHETVTANLAA
jgi:electron-transferring-flavoprotein dehydrogenase